MKPNRNTILQFKDLSLAYDASKVLLKSASASVKEGEMVVLVGSNGTGKSTLLRTLANMQQARTGEIHLGDKNLSEYTPQALAKKVSFVGAAANITENLSVSELVSMGRHPYTNWWGQLATKDVDIVNEAIGFVGMEDFTHVKVNRLSDGERQRIMIARALAQHTPLMILDEPTAFLDIPNRMGIAELLHRMRSKGHSVVLSTHDFDAAFQYADKMWVLHEQQLFEGGPEDLGMDGVLDKIFNKAGIELDHQDLRYKRKVKQSKPIRFDSADKEALLWTERALRRNGFTLTDKKETGFPVLSHSRERGSNRWEIIEEKTSQSFQSLYDVIIYLTKGR